MSATRIPTLKFADTPPTVADRRLQGLLRLARRHFGVSAALVLLADANRHWVGACDGLEQAEAAQALSFWRQMAAERGLLLIPDASADARCNAHPFVARQPHIRFHAACPLIGSNGDRIGAFCLFDHLPRSLDEEQCAFLCDLADLAAVARERDAAIDRLASEEAELRENEARVALAVEGSGTGIWDRNVRTGEIYYSSGWKAMFGYADHEISNRITDSYQRVHPDDLAYVQATMQAHFDRQTPSYEVEHRILCKDGSYKWVVSRGKVVSRDDEGRALRMIGTTTDITAIRAMSEKLRQTVALVTNLTNEVPGLVFQYRRLLDGRFCMAYASAGLRDIYELSPEEVANDAAPLDRVIHPDDLAAYHASLDKSALSLTPWHLEYRVRLPRQGLRWRQGDARPQRMEDGSTVWHGFITDITERKRIEAELQEFATTDFLTQLPNRRHFMTQIEAELGRVRRGGGRPAAVLSCDLDHFKSINDGWGHAVGDLALKHFAAILRAQLRCSDLAGRIGGEEFAIVLHGTDTDEATVFARRLQQRIAEMPLLHEGRRIALTVSIGIALLRAEDAGVDAALSRSDMALYRAKSSGRNRIECAG